MVKSNRNFSNPPIRSGGGFVEFRKSEINQSIPARFDQQVQIHRERPAIRMGGQEISYQSLDVLSNQIARGLHGTSDQGQEPVAILMSQGIRLIASILGILKAGKIYVPLDPAEPPDRLAATISEAGINLVVTDTANIKTAVSAARQRQQVLDIDSIKSDARGDKLEVRISPDDPAYIFFTSGTTGNPKGVVDSHRNVLHNIMRYTNNLRIGCDDRLTLLQACHFSGSVSSLFCGLLNGAIVYPFDLRASPIEEMAKLVADEAVTIYHSVPILFEQLMRADREFPHLRVIRLEGDRCAQRHVDLFQRRFSSDCILANGLGATETGLTNQFIVAPDTVIESKVIPVGFPTEDMETVILDESGRQLAQGRVGEIAFVSARLATGYWQNDALTKQKFVTVAGTDKRCYHTGDLGRVNDDGVLEHLGRLDFQVRIRGHRVDADAIEAVLEDLPGVSSAVVHGHKCHAGHQQLLAYFVLDSVGAADAVTEDGFRRQLAAHFPAYMIPSRFLRLERLPVDANGKVSRKDLSPPGTRRPVLSEAFVVPKTSAEKNIAAIWSELLNVREVGMNDDFFDLGGDSLLAMTLPMLINEKLGTRLSDASLLEAPTVAAMARQLLAAGNGRSLVRLQPAGSKRPIFFIHAHMGRVLEYRDLADLLGETQPFYALQPQGIGGDEPMLARIEDIAAHYLQEIRSVQKHGPYTICGYCLGGLIAFEMAQQLRADQEDNSLVMLIDTEAPRGRRFRWRLLRSNLIRFFKRRHRQEAPKLPWNADSSKIQESLDIARQNYRAIPCPGDMMFVAAEKGSSVDFAPEAGWEKLLQGRLTTISIPRLAAPYDYKHLFHEPYLSRLAEVLKAAHEAHMQANDTSA